MAVPRGSAEYRWSRHWTDDYWRGETGPIGSGRDSGGSVDAEAMLYDPRGNIVFVSRMRRAGFSTEKDRNEHR